MSEALKGSLLQFGTSFISSMANSGSNANIYKAKQNAALSNSALLLIKNARDAEYMNRISSQEVWNTLDRASVFSGTQRVIQGASNMGISAGAKRLTYDTARKASEAVQGINESTTREQFLADMDMATKRVQYDYEAKAYKIMADSESGMWGFLKNITNSAISALGAYMTYSSYEDTRNNNNSVSGDYGPVSNFQPDAIQYSNNRSYTNYQYEALQNILYGGSK